MAIAQSEEQLTRWLSRYYEDINPSNVGNAVKISKMMFTQQQGKFESETPKSNFCI
jgi:hypothetical protein